MSGPERCVRCDTVARGAFYLPVVPTMMEAGIPDFEVDSGRQGLYLPADCPAEIVSKLQGEVRLAWGPPGRERIAGLGLEPVGARRRIQLFVRPRSRSTRNGARSRNPADNAHPLERQRAAELKAAAVVFDSVPSIRAFWALWYRTRRTGGTVREQPHARTADECQRKRCRCRNSSFAGGKAEPCVRHRP